MVVATVMELPQEVFSALLVAMLLLDEALRKTLLDLTMYVMAARFPEISGTLTEPKTNPFCSLI
jgi:hypothetical protein